MPQTFVVLSAPGSKRDLTKTAREQRFWDEHAAYIDALVDAGFVMLGGPLADGGAMLVVRAGSEADVHRRLGADPWYRHEILRMEAVKRWDIFIDERE